jgi:hypothetical protein
LCHKRKQLLQCKCWGHYFENTNLCCFTCNCVQSKLMTSKLNKKYWEKCVVSTFIKCLSLCGEDKRNFNLRLRHNSMLLPQVQLLLCKIRGFHNSDLECHLLGCDTMLVIANVPSWLILFTLMMEVIHSSETPFLPRAMWHHITEDGILQFLTTLRFSVLTWNHHQVCYCWHKLGHAHIL